MPLLAYYRPRDAWDGLRELTRVHDLALTEHITSRWKRIYKRGYRARVAIRQGRLIKERCRFNTNGYLAS